MDIVARAKNIILNPVREWEVIKAEPIATGEMFKYAAILAALPAVAGFIGQLFAGQRYRVSIGVELASAVLWYIVTLVGGYLFGLVIDMLAPSFDCARNMNAALKISVFSWSALWLAGVLAVIPSLSILIVLGLYSFYLLYLGLRSLMAVPPDKLAGYYVVTVIVGFLVFVVVNVVAGLVRLSEQMP